MNNPELFQQLLAATKDGAGKGSGGARPNSGPEASGYQKPAIDAQADVRRQITKGDGTGGV